MKEKKESEFLSRMDEIADQARALVKEGDRKGLIVVAVEISDDEDAYGTIVAVSGRGKEIAMGIGCLVHDGVDKKVFAKGLELAGELEKEKHNNHETEH